MSARSGELVTKIIQKTAVGLHLKNKLIIDVFQGAIRILLKRST